MKTIILIMTTIVFSLFTLIAFADKVIITGSPVVIEKQGEVYVPSGATVTTDQDYYYFSADDTKQVCYKTVQPGLASVDLGTMSVRVGDSTVSLHCYTYSPDYFDTE